MTIMNEKQMLDKILAGEIKKERDEESRREIMFEQDRERRFNDEGYYD